MPYAPKALAAALVLTAASFATAPARALQVDLPRCGVGVHFHGLDAILVEARINGRGPYEVLFDTGANSVISDRLARALGIATGKHEKLGAFAGAVDTGQAVVKRFQLGGLTLRDLPVHVLPFPYALVHMSRRPIAAVIGEDLMPLMAIRIDNVAHTVSFCPAAQFKPPSGVASVPLRRGPDGYSIEARLDGEPARFGVDTGQDLSLAVYTQAVKDRNLIARYHATAGGVTGQGFGGQTTGWFARAPSIGIGGAVVRDSIARLATDTAGIGTGDATGNLGMGVFKRFTLALDGPHDRAYFEPNGQFNAPDVFNRAGLGMEEQADGAHIVTVFAGGPAAKAGLRTGDIVLSADGRTTEVEDAFDAVFRKPSGTVVTLKVRGRAKPVRLLLRDVL